MCVSRIHLDFSCVIKSLALIVRLISINTACHSGPHEKRLLHNLLDAYNVLERPVVNESDPLQLSFGLTLMQIIDVVSVHSVFVI